MIESPLHRDSFSLQAEDEGNDNADSDVLRNIHPMLRPEAKIGDYVDNKDTICHSISVYHILLMNKLPKVANIEKE